MVEAVSCYNILVALQTSPVESDFSHQYNKTVARVAAAVVAAAASVVVVAAAAVAAAAAAAATAAHTNTSWGRPTQFKRQSGEQYGSR